MHNSKSSSVECHMLSSRYRCNYNMVWMQHLTQQMYLNNWTGQQTSLILHHLKCCFSHSEMPERFDTSNLLLHHFLYLLRKKVTGLVAVTFYLIIDILHQVPWKSIFCSLDHMRWKWSFIPKCLFHSIRRKQTIFSAPKGTIFVHFLWEYIMYIDSDYRKEVSMSHESLLYLPGLTRWLFQGQHLWWKQT